MPKKDPFQKFIEEGIAGLDEIEGDPLVKDVDEALAEWITEYYPRGFDFSYERRDLAIDMVKEGDRMLEMILASPFRTYINAIIYMKHKEEVQKELEESKRAGRQFNNFLALMKFSRLVFSLGYALRCLEEKKKKTAGG